MLCPSHISAGLMWGEGGRPSPSTKATASHTSYLVPGKKMSTSIDTENATRRVIYFCRYSVSVQDARGKIFIFL